MKDMLTIIFCEFYDFCKFYKKDIDNFLRNNFNKIRNREHKMQLSEILTIMIFFNASNAKNFKNWYENDILVNYRSEFRNLVSYNRFLEFKKKYGIILYFFLQIKKLDTSQEIKFIDSFSIKACHIKREYSNKVMKNYAAKGKSSMGWFYGLKLHVVLNANGELASFGITPGNVMDNNENVIMSLFKGLYGKTFGDRGYLLNQSLKDFLKKNRSEMITRVRKNMKEIKLDLYDNFILCKRNIIESVGNILKNHLNLEHTRHRSACGFLQNIFSALCAYTFRLKKPSVNIHFPIAP